MLKEDVDYGVRNGGGAVRGETVDSAASATGFEILGCRYTEGCSSGRRANRPAPG